MTFSVGFSGERLKMLEETPDQLLARKDPLVSLGFGLDRDVRDLSDRRDRWDGTITRLWDGSGPYVDLDGNVWQGAGLLTGHLLLSKKTAEQKITGLYFAGFLSLGLSLIWNAWLPINKNLWTSSFVLYTAGVDAMILASLYFLTDVVHHTD